MKKLRAKERKWNKLASSFTTEIDLQNNKIYLSSGIQSHIAVYHSSTHPNLTLIGIMNFVLVL